MSDWYPADAPEYDGAVTSMSTPLIARMAAGIDRLDRVIGAESRGRVAQWGLFVTFVLVTAERVLGTWNLGTFAIDLRIYRAAAAAAIHGADPWSVSVGGFGFAGPPPTLLPYMLAALLPEPVAIAIYGAIGLAAAMLALRALQLPIWWLMFPPISDSLIVVNPDVVVIALLVALPRLASLAVVLKLYAAAPLALTWRWRPLALSLLICVLSAPWWSAFVAAGDSIQAGLAAQSFGGISAWGTWLMIPTVVALAAIWRRGAAWLTVPALWPYTQLHYAAIALPIASRDAVVAFLLSFPVVYLAPIATIYYAIRLIAVVKLAAYRSGATKKESPPSA